MFMIRMAAAMALGLALAGPAAAQGIPRVQSPEEVGFLSTRLKRLSDRLNEGVKNNELPGAVVLIARNGKIVMFESYGFRDKDAKVAMTNDTIFRIASMTKPIVTLAGNMFSTGVDPELDLTEIEEVARIAQECTRLPVHPHRPSRCNLGRARR